MGVNPETGMILGQGEAARHVMHQFVDQNQGGPFAHGLFHGVPGWRHAFLVVFPDRLVALGASDHQGDLAPGRECSRFLAFERNFGPYQGVGVFTDEHPDFRIVRLGEKRDAVA